MIAGTTAIVFAVPATLALGSTIIHHHRIRRHVADMTAQHEQAMRPKPAQPSLTALQAELLPRYGGSTARWVAEARKAAEAAYTPIPCDCLDCVEPEASGWEHHACELAPAEPDGAMSAVVPTGGYYETIAEAMIEPHMTPNVRAAVSAARASGAAISGLAEKMDLMQRMSDEMRHEMQEDGSVSERYRYVEGRGW